MIDRILCHAPPPRARMTTLLAAIGLSLILGDRAMAGLTIEIEPANVNATLGTSNNVLNVLLVSDASTPADELSSYYVAISAPSGSGITFTGADTSTGQAYIFDSDNSGQFTYLPDTPDPNSAAITDYAADLDLTISPNTTYGLGEIFFSVDPGAQPGVDPVSFSAGSSLTGGPDTGPDGFDNLTDVAYVGGQITVLAPAPPPSPAATPEPSTLVLMGIGLATSGSAWLRRRLSS